MTITPPHFLPVPAVPIVVVSARKGDCRVLVAGALASGKTLRAAIESTR